jgi:hypothetical protein
MTKGNRESGLNAAKNPIYISAVIVLALAYSLLFHRNILVYGALLAGSATLHYMHYKGFPSVNLGHVFFIAFMIDWHDGLAGEILFIILAGLVPEIMAGYLEFKTFFSYPIMAAVISIPIALYSRDLQLVGIVSGLVYYLIMFFVSGFTREPWHERFLEVIVPCVLNVFYFMYLSGPLYWLLDIVLP